VHHPITGFEHLHRHSDSSLLDGMALVSEYAEYSKAVNQQYLCITDHGVLGAVPEQVSESEKHGLTPIFGIELYVNPMQPKSDCREDTANFRKNLPEDQQKKFDKSNHLLAIAYNNEGYKNLVRLSSWAWRYGFYKRPRVNHEILQQHKNGIIFTSTCAASEIATAFLANQDDQEGFDMIEKYISMFGKEHFRLELMMLDYKPQKPYDAFLLRAHDKYHIPLIVTQDCFVANTLVLTSSGYKTIDHIVAGDMVYTHKNRWREVEIVASRKLKDGESVYRVKARAGTYAYESTGKHKVYTAKKEGDIWVFDWVKVEKLVPKKDYLVLPKINPDDVFASNPLENIDILPFLDSYDYQHGAHYETSNKGNMACRLQYLPETGNFVSYKDWTRSCITSIPRYLTVDDDLLKIIGWYMAEGWSEKKSNQVGFAFHENERSVAEWVVSYFARFGITSKIYKVSENGIAVRFSSVVFNRFFGQLCGFGANNKHLPYPDKCTWIGKWDRQQIAVILSCYWEGDGSTNGENSKFNSTSKTCIFEIATIFNALGMPSLPSREDNSGKNWKDCWHLNFSSDRHEALHRFFNGGNVSQPSGFWKDLGSSWGLVVDKVDVVPYEGLVYDMQVAEDHSYTANLYNVSNCHFCKREHSKYQQLMLMMQNGRTIQEIDLMIASGADDIFELQDTNLWMKSEDELNEKWESDFQEIIDYELYKQSKANTVEICRLASGVEIDKSIKLPELPQQNTLLLEEIKKGFFERNVPRDKIRLERVKMEYELITKKGFASYFLIEQMMVKEAMRICPEICGFDDISVARGPGRGSVGGSLVAYLLDLHDLDPIEHDLPFERFLSWARGGKQMKLRFTQKPLES
jgi:PHP domain/Bacterial DNA polymerase III alpha NTPase domain/LAGLIDADG-like domain